MRYFVTDAQGQHYGPADLRLLDHWAMEGRILPMTVLVEETTGNRVYAQSIPTLAMTFQSLASRYPGSAGSLYGSAPRYPATPYQGRMPSTGANALATTSIVLSILGLVCCGSQFALLLPVSAMLIGLIAKRKGATSAVGAIVLAVIVTLIHIAIRVSGSYFRF